MVSKKERALATGILTQEQRWELFWRRYWFRSFLGITAGGRLLWIGALGMIWIILWWKFYAVPEKKKKSQQGRTAVH